MPCPDTRPDVYARLVTISQADFNDCGFDLVKTYRYQNTQDCDPYCGKWFCLTAANDTENRCVTEVFPGDGGNCPPCSPWDGTADPPFQVIRPEEFPEACNWFVEIETDCCDDACPEVICDGFGWVRASDCIQDGTCYNPSSISWSVGINATQIAAQITEHGYTMNLSNKGIRNVTSTIVGLTLRVEFDAYLTFVTSPSANPLIDCGDPNNCDPFVGDPRACLCADPDPCDVYPDTFEVELGRFVASIPCMSSPSVVSAFGSVQSINPPTYCGNLQVSTTIVQNAGAGQSTGNVLGWGGSGKVSSRTQTLNYNLGAHPFLSPGWQETPGDPALLQAGSCTYELFMTASLPERPPTCPAL